MTIDFYVQCIPVSCSSSLVKCSMYTCFLLEVERQVGPLSVKQWRWQWAKLIQNVWLVAVVQFRTSLSALKVSITSIHKTFLGYPLSLVTPPFFISAFPRNSPVESMFTQLSRTWQGWNFCVGVIFLSRYYQIRPHGVRSCNKKFMQVCNTWRTTLPSLTKEGLV